MAKILIFDIETTPNLGYVWQKYQQDVLEYVSEWEMLCFGYKWLGEKETVVVGLNQFSEEILVRRLWQLFDEADIIIAHNGNSFDVKMCNAKFIEFGLQPPSNYKTIDTKLVARRYFRFNSNKLDDLGHKLGLGRKLQTGGFSLWMGCMAGDKKAWNKMLRYNRQDVLLLEKVYLKLRPWIENHPNIGLIDEGNPDNCENCGHHKLHRRGTRYTSRRRYERLRCTKCGHWQKGKLIR